MLCTDSTASAMLAKGSAEGFDTVSYSLPDGCTATLAGLGKTCAVTLTPPKGEPLTHSGSGRVKCKQLLYALRDTFGIEIYNRPKSGKLVRL
jgi:hypothetical protein